jgi:hypothetical protein
MIASTHSPPFLRSVLCGWLSWLYAFAIWSLINFGSSSPFNGPTTYFLFSSFLSMFYLLDYIIVVPLTCAVLTELWPNSRPWQWAVLGSAPFALSVPLWEGAFHHDDRSDTILLCVLATIAGATSFYVLRHSNSLSRTTA